ncbi:MAG: hypothetical protein JNL72_04780 [Flavipsychrobacter sp.]|nr:hypothetical protein [Flavipsychrobacter sp.]
MKVKMLITATVVAMLSLVFADNANAQRGRGGYYNRGGNCGPGYAPQRYYGNNCNTGQWRRPVVRNCYRPPVPRCRTNRAPGFYGAYTNGYTTTTVTVGAPAGYVGGYYTNGWNNGGYYRGNGCGNGYYRGNRRW